MLKNLLMSLALIAAPVAVFAGVWAIMPHTQEATASALGDLSAFEVIVADTRAIAETGDLTAAEVRITDLDVAWDTAQATLRPLDTAAWGSVDDAADAAFRALRTATPDAATVLGSLDALSATLASPIAGPVVTGGVTMIGAIAVPDETGHAIPCEEMLRTLGERVAAAPPPAGTDILDLQTRATERCNADDDTRANAFTAQALNLVSN